MIGSRAESREPTRTGTVARVKTTNVVADIGHARLHGEPWVASLNGSLHDPRIVEADRPVVVRRVVRSRRAGRTVRRPVISQRDRDG